VNILDLIAPKELALSIKPRIGGVGSTTVAMLFNNTIKLEQTIRTFEEKQ